MSSLTVKPEEVQDKSHGFKVPTMGKKQSDSWIPVKSLMRPSEIRAFDDKARKNNKYVILVPTSTYTTEKGTRKWVAEFREQIPLGTQIIRDQEKDLVPLPVIKGG
jgi:hypothetical protein